jgi:hypothetical protein
MKKLLFSLMLGLGVLMGAARPAMAVDGVYLGGELGFVGLTDNIGRTNNNGLGFGFNLGLRANPLLDIMAGFQRSTHSGQLAGVGDLTLYSTTLSAAFHFLQVDDFDLSLMGGPGFYFFNTAAGNATKFGLHGGLAGDVVIEDALRVGIAWKYHGVFGTTTGGGSYWTVMMRVG